MSSAGSSHDGKPASSDSARTEADDSASSTQAQNGDLTGAPTKAAIVTAVPDRAANGQAGATPSSATSSGAATAGAAPSGAATTVTAAGREPGTSDPAKSRQNPGGSAFGAIGRFFRRFWRPAWVRHLVLALIYVGAGIAATWPRFTYLVDGKLPRTTDAASFVWGFWWVAHQVTHLGNPFFTNYMAAPVGIQLGFSTLMPLAGFIMTPVTLLWGPSAAFTSLTLITPGLLCYAMYRAARLWLNQPGSIAAGAIYGLSSMVLWQVWYHINIAVGLIFLPLVIEAAVRFRRSGKIAPAVWLGVALGASVMTSQEGAAVALLLVAALLIPWIIGKLFSDRESLGKAMIPLGLGALVAFAVASPQLLAMLHQINSGGATTPPGTLAMNYTQFGVPLQTLFAPTPRISYYGLGHVVPTGWAFNTTPQFGTSVQPQEGLPGFGLAASVLAGLGALIAWRKRTTWWFVLLWLGCAILALGTSLTLGNACVVNQANPGQVYGKACHQYIPFLSHFHYVYVHHIGVDAWERVTVSNLMPYTWLVRFPPLSGLREADRFALVGMIGVALLAGVVVQWISRRRRGLSMPLIALVTAACVFEAGWAGGTNGPPHTPTETMPTTMPGFDSALKADHSHKAVLDVPFGLRGGLRLVGSGISERAMLLATSDGHPRSVSYTAWVPVPTVKAITSHPFYHYLLKYQNATSYPKPYQLKAAAADLKTLNIGWAIEWTNLWRSNHPEQRLWKVEAYLRRLGFRRVHLACLVPSQPGTVCSGRELEKVWLLKYIPADAYGTHHHHHLSEETKKGEASTPNR
ncbi:MAG TPA: hypothetical protein VFQ44_18900 [Streptosporangiaceae bacterium]|nr:hypothetical protein [Streptosporangiaceae bacterium]